MRLTTTDGKYTEYIYDDYKGINCIGSRTVNNELTQKLCEYENIDDELGIPWPILYKALEKGIWVRHIKRGKVFVRAGLGNHQLLADINNRSFILWEEHAIAFKDYKKSWALRKEELL